MRGNRRRLSWLASALVLTAPALCVPFSAETGAQAPAGSDETKAAAAYTAQDWATAGNLYASLTKANPESGRFWYRLAVCERAEKHFDRALEAFAKAKTLGAGKGLPAPLADYQIAATYAAMEDAPHALATLKASADGGFSQLDSLAKDPEWDSLRKDEQFLALEKEVKHNAAPCEDPEFRQFDFWLGDWDVVSTADGTGTGSSHIASEMGGCVIWENWTSGGGSGYFGKSYNTYNVNLHRWEQYWVDNSAGTMFFHGDLKDGVMDYWTDEVPQPNGDKLLRHLQFFNLSPDKVRQLSQGSTDGGKSWHVEYDLTYQRRKPASAPIR